MRLRHAKRRASVEAEAEVEVEVEVEVAGVVHRAGGAAVVVRAGGVMTYVSVRANPARDRDHLANVAKGGTECNPRNVPPDYTSLHHGYFLNQPESGLTEKFFVGVDVTEKFPFFVTKISPYYKRRI